jgi:hypothetical protein
MSNTNVENGHNEKSLKQEHLENSKLDGHHDGLGNEHAFKGDDSDGSVEWSPKQVIAAVSLGCLYAGTLLFDLIWHN